VIDAGGQSLRTRFNGQPVAVCRALTKGPMGSARQHEECLVLFPVHPLPVAKSREALTPSRATADPTDATLQVELLLTHRDTLPPLVPQSPEMRALAPRVAHRRRLVGDTVHRTKRLTSALKHDVPHGLQWLQEQAPAIFGDFLSRWPTLKAVQLARRTTLAHFFRAPPVRSPDVITTRSEAMTNARALTTADGVITPKARLVHALVAPRRVTLQAMADFDTASAHRAQDHPAFPFFDTVPGAGAVLAPRLLVACGEQRAREASAEALQKSAGIAPVTERRGKQAWGHWRLPGPTCLRHTFVAWAAESIRHACWAHVYSQPQRDQGKAHQAAVRALAFKGIRMLARCWHERTPSAESPSLQALHRRGSSLIPHLAKAPEKP